MTRYVGTVEMAQLLRRLGPDTVLRRLAACLHADFLRWPEFDLAPRLASHFPHGVIELMPVCDGRLYAFKFVNGHPGNPRSGRQTVVAFGALADVTTGYPVLVSEMTVLTALRTAATSALAASFLARPGSRSMALIGTGAQAEFQALAFKAICGITEVRLFDIDAQAVAKARANLEGRGLRLVCAETVAEAVAGADIVTTATADKARVAILTADLVESGQHLNAIGGDCPGKTELQRDILVRARTVVEYAPQTRIEGEIQQMPADYPVTELWRVLRGEAPGRERAGDITLFDSVGFALEDFSALRCLLDLAGSGPDLDLVPMPDDPKDLFGSVFTAGIDSERAA
ncbi:ornithine cyclodeaminase [Methylobacterium sp. B4]|uniref:ornithine cyclodeaminase n=1 Tax=Methylobacterium sp. B4 TaxID=1938755 RepID=UPI000D773AAF|nr:ornithine cyclodeaminase [Methylobacterium sp. B4]PXW66936.1 ornithine cyclodeaminase [Methylobacterium sp. B4]